MEALLLQRWGVLLPISGGHEVLNGLSRWGQSSSPGRWGCLVAYSALIFLSPDLILAFSAHILCPVICEDGTKMQRPHLNGLAWNLAQKFYGWWFCYIPRVENLLVTVSYQVLNILYYIYLFCCFYNWDKSPSLSNLLVSQCESLIYFLDHNWSDFFLFVCLNKL